MDHLPSDDESPPSAEEFLGTSRILLASLMRSEALERGDVETALAQLTETAARALRVERASVWVFIDDERARLECRDLFELVPRRHSSGQALLAADTPAYFRALAAERAVAAHDARQDPRTSEFTPQYLMPHGITSMLDAPILVGGKLAGVVCLEHVGPQRVWTELEELMAGTFADFVAMALGSAERAKQARALEAYRAKLEQLVEQRTQQLRQSEEAFRQLFDAAPVALILSTLADQVVITANRRAAELFEVSIEEVTGQHAPDFWEDPADRHRLLDALRTRGSVGDFEARLHTSSNKPFWGALEVRTLTAEGKPAVLVGVRDITAHKDLEERLRQLATIDDLTGVLNRRRLFEIAEQEVGRAARYERSLCVAMFDLDHFKSINDRFGHAAGDETLRRVAAVLREGVRRLDFVGRYGGEELMIVFPESETDDALTACERMRQRVETLELASDDRRISVTVSAGIVEWRRGESLAAVVRRADDALYQAKAAGRNRIVRG